MKNKKELNKEILLTTISTIAFVVVFIITIVIVLNSVFGPMKNKEQIGKFLVDYKQTKFVKGNLGILPNQEGIKTTGYEITITNNYDEEKEYYLYIKDKKGNDLNESLIVSLNDFIIKKASSLPKDEEKYILHKGSIKPGYSSIHILKFWWKYGSDQNLLNKKVNIEYGIIEK